MIASNTVTDGTPLSARQLATRAVSFAALLVIVCFLATTAADADLWGHLTFGRDIVRSGWVHTSDPYSFTSDRPWINHEWFAEVMMWAAYSIGGAAGLVALKLMLACAAGLALVDTWRRYSLPNPVRDGLLFLIALGTWPLLATIRPQAFSVFLFALLLFVVDRIRARGAGWLFALPPIFAVWVNAHGGWIVGAGALALFVACACCSRTWTGRKKLLLLGSACLSALATLCNPYGTSMLAFLEETVRPARADIIEWQPTTGVPLAGLVLWLVPTAVAVVGLWKRRRPPDAYSLLLTLLLAVGSFRVIRLVGFYALAVGFLVGPVIGISTADDRPQLSGRAADWRLAFVACAAAIAIAVTAFGRTLDMDGPWLPEREATVFLQTHDIKGRMLTWFDYGEFAIWHFAPAVRVSMDGRRETVYSDEMRERHLRIYTNAPSAVEEVARLDPDYVWLPARFHVVERLESAGWRPVFEGPRSVVLSRQPVRVMTSTVASAAGRRVFPGP